MSEVINAYHRKHYAIHKDEIAVKKKAYRIANPIKRWCSIVRHAHKDRGYIVDITSQELEQLAIQTTHCKYCGNELDYFTAPGSRKDINANCRPSLDRIDNEQHMNLNNVEIICVQCNTTKGARTEKEFFEYCSRVCSTLKEKY